ncbi:MAG: hypothetical protein DRP02_08830 [Candidatus Gerdarchaeota archaeon]|nr:MAG: hypothetical protein DRP02_08830 [Candidatus Gerdarchaeota archaeon]
MTDLKITLNVYACIQRKKMWDKTFDWQTIQTIMLPEEKRPGFLVDAHTLNLEEKLREGLQKLNFLSVITRVKDSFDSKNPSLEALRDLLLSLYVELQDAKNNTDDDELLELLQHMDAELVAAAKIVAKLEDKKNDC